MLSCVGMRADCVQTRKNQKELACAAHVHHVHLTSTAQPQFTAQCHIHTLADCARCARNNTSSHVLRMHLTCTSDPQPRNLNSLHSIKYVCSGPRLIKHKRRQSIKLDAFGCAEKSCGRRGVCSCSHSVTLERWVCASCRWPCVAVRTA